MDNIATIIGQRIKNQRKAKKLSQEQLAELCDLHPTYIGQIERGEKNATLESISKIVNGLNIPLEELFANIPPKSDTVAFHNTNRISALLADVSPQDQKILLDILESALKLKE